jgi:AraC family transcriptional regulator
MTSTAVPAANTPPGTPPCTPVRYLELLARAAAHVDAHLDGDLGADTLADCAAMSRHHFHRMFRAYFGTSVQGYVTWRRLRRACELLAAGDLPVLEVALAVGYDSSQALAKAMRRELDTTPTGIRAGSVPDWQRLFDRRGLPPMPEPIPTPEGAFMLKPQLTHAPALHVLTATGRGMEQGDMSRAAKQAFGELMPAVQAAGAWPPLSTCLALFPDEPSGGDDQQCRLLAGLVFGHVLHERRGDVQRPPLPLTGTLAWWDLPAGRYAVFTHVGPYAGLHTTWTAIYRDWLPATGNALRDVPPFEVYVNDASVTPPAQLRTDIYLPLE